MTSSVVGANVSQTFTTTVLPDGRSFGLGDRYTDHAGKEYVFVVAGGDIDQYDFVVFDEAYSATALSTSNDAYGDLVGVAGVAFASGEYGWVQVKGPCTANILASTSANGRLMTTATAGHADDTATGVSIQGATNTAATSGADAAVAAMLNYPQIGETVA